MTLPLPTSDWHPTDEVATARELRRRAADDTHRARAYMADGLVGPALVAIERAERRTRMAALVECNPVQTDRAYVQVLSREPKDRMELES